MRLFEQFDEICKYFAEGKQRDNNTNEVQKHLQLQNISVGEYLTDRSSIDFGIYLHTIFHSVFTFMVQSPQNLRSSPYNRKLENGS